MAETRAEESFLEERMRAVEEAEEQEAERRKKLIGLVVGFGLLLALHFGPALPGDRRQLHLSVSDN